MTHGEIAEAKRDIDKYPLAAYYAFIKDNDKLRGFFDPIEDAITRNKPIRILMYRGIKCNFLQKPKNPPPINPSWFGNPRL